MKVIEDRCCNCAVPSYPCRGELCPNRHYVAYYCDICGAEMDNETNVVDGSHYCETCYNKEFGELEDE